MDGSDEIRQLLREIRDTQREQLAEYRKVAERSWSCSSVLSRARSRSGTSRGG
jgi:hypothetical protein